MTPTGNNADQNHRNRAIRRCLRRPFKPSVTRDSEIPGLCLHVTTRAIVLGAELPAEGHKSSDRQAMGRRRRFELGDAMLTTVAEARTAALAAKALIRQGRSPHHERYGLHGLRCGSSGASCPQPSPKPSTPMPPR